MVDTLDDSIDFVDGGLAPSIFSKGYYLSPRNSPQQVWRKDHIYFKLWHWMMGKANHETVKVNGFVYERGILYTNYEEIIKALTIYKSNKKVEPSLKRVRVMLGWFTSQKEIEATPLRRSEAPPIFHPIPTQNASLGADVRAYVGLKIRITKYDIYQSPENYLGRHRDRRKGKPRADQGQNNKKDSYKNDSYKNEGEIYCNNHFSPKARKQSLQSPEGEVFMRAWSESFSKAFGKPYPINKRKDFDVAQEIMETCPLPDIKPSIERFFKEKNDFVEKAGHSIGIFQSQLSRLLSTTYKPLVGSPEYYEEVKRRYGGADEGANGAESQTGDNP
jgi:hypothetical protein